MRQRTTRSACETRWLSVSAAVVVTLAGEAPARAQDNLLASTKPPAPKAEEELVPSCKTELRLSGTVYDAAHPERSFALVQFRQNQAAGVFRAGAQLGAFELIVIEPRGVLLRYSDGECWLRLVGDPVVRAQRAAARPPRASKAKHRNTQHKKSSVVVIGHR